ncbi:M20/M25/M40 family metallo-hydrolase [Sphingomonas ginkgonis]|uniref:M20/M25/M40 family metallo-hydrolase n=1 Tax=Sphingomonas ginkgonis TaxID=2315330 RepID=A0A429V9X1_9SPHN|nr:M28 family metallopeptidase [Sphingomonas ginkgonis]RST30781.1 M20/M25/M40 family metallo-hydrolase [Sphingomonas ginkgonis]
MRKSLVLLLAAASVPAAAAPSAAPAVNTARMSEITRTLASEAFEGRAPGTPGEAKTIPYLIEQFRAAGLQPAGENGGWTQKVPMIRTRLQNVRMSIAQDGQTVPLRFPDDVYVSTQKAVDQARIAAAPLVFVGYGVSAPERGWDDFKGADLRGKVAVILVNDPDYEAKPGEPVAGKFGGPTMTYYGRWTYKYEEAARRGAIGALIVHETGGAGYGWNVVQSSGGENYNIVLPAGAQQPVLLQGWIQRPVAEAMFRRAGLDYDTLKRQARTSAFRPIDLHATLSADSAVELTHLTSQNVLGQIRGSRFPAETVSYGGHWDAYGVGKPDAQGRTIRPGAADDGLGLAGMLEIARMFRAGPRPQRTVLFAAWTGEERGLLGSEYYARHPLFPHETMAANLTLDTLQFAGPTRDTVVIGRGQDSLEDMMAEEARKQGRSVTVESHPERGLFYRADHFSFAKRGVPTLLTMALAGEYDLVDGGRPAGAKWLADYTGNCYHQTCDEWSASWNLGGAAQEVDMMYRIGARLANSRIWPSWKPSSEFAPIRRQSAARRR